MAGQRIRDRALAQGVIGLKELQQELRRGGPEMAKRLQEINKKLVMEVADKAKARWPSSVAQMDPSFTPSGRIRPSGRGSLSRSRDSVRGTARQTSASVVGGGSKAEGFFGHEFGGRRRPSTMQFPAHRGRQGYTLYPTVREERAKAEARWAALFDEVFP